MGSVKRRDIDRLIAELEALEEVGVIDGKQLKAATAYVDNHPDEVEEWMGPGSKYSEVADLVVAQSRLKGAGNPVGYRKTTSTTEGESEMAAKKGKKAKGKGKAKKAAKVVTGGESRPRVTIANFIRDKLEKAGKDYDAKKIAEQAAAEFPDKKPTPGYVNWIHEHAPKVSTTTTVAA